jgi:hypothetical protein
MNKANSVKREKINSKRCTNEGTNKKLRGGTIGNNLSDSQTSHEIAFATSQKKQISLVTIIFFETKDKLEKDIMRKLFQSLSFKTSQAI